MPAIQVQDVSKRFRRYQANRPTSLQELFLRGFRGLQSDQYFWVLREVSFDVSRGKVTGIIGRNGAGKSTLLRLVGGVGRPDKGKIKVEGRIGALIDLGAGFHPDLTGRENVFVNGCISGLTRQEVSQQFDEIVAFAELEEFIDSPLRTYSTGMQMRLGFAVAAHVRPEVLLIDEVLAVGDLAFQRKCLAHLRQVKEQGAAILLVTHDMGVVQQMCDEAIWLDDSRVLRKGPSEAVAHEYILHMQSPVSGADNSSDELILNVNRFGTQALQLSDIHITAHRGVDSDIIGAVASGDAILVDIAYQVNREMEMPIFALLVVREDGLNCLEIYSDTSVEFQSLAGRSGRVQLLIERLDLVGGHYYVEVGAYSSDWAELYDYHWRVYAFDVVKGKVGKGLLAPPHKWTAY